MAETEVPERPETWKPSTLYFLDLVEWVFHIGFAGLAGWFKGDPQVASGVVAASAPWISIRARRLPSPKEHGNV